jgi:hypothetical protein
MQVLVGIFIEITKYFFTKLKICHKKALWRTTGLG